MSRPSEQSESCVNCASVFTCENEIYIFRYRWDVKEVRHLHSFPTKQRIESVHSRLVWTVVYAIITSHASPKPEWVNRTGERSPGTQNNMPYIWAFARADTAHNGNASHYKPIFGGNILLRSFIDTKSARKLAFFCASTMEWMLGFLRHFAISALQ